MARLLMKNAELGTRTLELRLGVTRVGRSPDADFQIQDPTVSAFHCEFSLNDAGVSIRDLGATNGIFVDGERVSEARLGPGQVLRIGSVELLVEETECPVAIPQFVNPEAAARPGVRDDGTLMCPRHSRVPARYRCTACQELLCDGCIHRIRVQSGTEELLLCPLCGQRTARLKLPGEERAPRKSSLAALVQTVKMKISRALNLDRGKQ